MPSRRYGVTLVTLLVLAFLAGCSDESVESRTTVGKNRKVILYSANSWEVSQAWYCEVYDDGKVVVPMTFVGACQPGTGRFIAVPAGDVVGIVHVNKLVLLYDFATGDKWPAGLGAERAKEEEAVRDRLVKAFNDGKPFCGPMQPE